MVEGANIISEARRWLGVRWQHQGRSRNGVDCAGLCVCVAQELGLEVEDVRGYPRRQDGTRLMNHLGTILRPVLQDQGCPGDIALFRESGFPIHIGFLALQGGIETVIHAHARRRKVIEEPLEAFGKPFATYRLKERV